MAAERPGPEIVTAQTFPSMTDNPVKFFRYLETVRRKMFQGEPQEDFRQDILKQWQIINSALEQEKFAPYKESYSPNGTLVEADVPLPLKARGVQVGNAFIAEYVYHIDPRIDPSEEDPRHHIALRYAKRGNLSGKPIYGGYIFFNVEPDRTLIDFTMEHRSYRANHGPGGIFVTVHPNLEIKDSSRFRNSARAK